MKKMMILSLGCVVLFLAPIIWAQEKVDAPVFNIGSKWHYKAKAGWEWVNELIREQGDIYVMRSVRGTQEILNFYDKKSMNLVKRTVDEKKDRSEYLHKKFFDFPVWVQKKWNYRYSYYNPRLREDRDLLSELSVLGFEDVEVRAGRFKAIKIKVKVNRIGTGASGIYYYWYSPEAKALVKEDPDIGTIGFWENPDGFRFELISFDLK